MLDCLKTYRQFMLSLILTVCFVIVALCKTKLYIIDWFVYLPNSWFEFKVFLLVCVCVCVCVCVVILTMKDTSLRISVYICSNTRSIFNQSTASLNSEFSFSSTGYLTKTKDPCLSYYFIIRDRFMPLSRILVWKEAQTILSRIWTWVNNHCWIIN